MTSEARKAWERQQRENRIIDMAEPVFFKKGYDATTIIEIADASGYNKRSIYLYFRDKEDIFLAVVLRGLKLLYTEIETASGISDGAPLDLKKLGRAFYDFSLAHPDYLKLIMVYEASTCVYRQDSPDGNGPEADTYKRRCQEKTDALADLMTRCLAKAIQDGQIRTDLTPEQLMLILWGQVFGVIQIILMRREGFSDTYGTSYESLFNTFLDMTAKSLS
ncbi:MAG: TetR/AcrR family transcriptional regulator [Desulfobacterales bacterium]|nr:TetR/AcrR family transcriptional regulator [Desulfobacterales bacterium]